MKENDKVNALVTGGAGFIGSHLVEELLKDPNISVTVVDNFSTGKYENISKHVGNKNFTLKVEDFASAGICQAIIDGKFNYIFHFAADASVPYSVEYPIKTNENNVSKTLLLLEASRKSKLKKFIFSSSSAVYGNTEQIPTKETSIKKPTSPYALQKSIIEEYCILYNKLYGLKSVCLRYFNVFGPRQAGSGPYANVISSWCENGLRSNKIRLDGNGTALRDFVFVKDVINSNILAAKSDIEFGCYNIGSGSSYSIKSILDIFLSEFPKMKVIDAPARSGDVIHTEADISLASNEIGYILSQKSFMENLIDTFNWYKENVR